MPSIKMFSQALGNVPSRGQAFTWGPDQSDADIDIDNDGFMSVRGQLDLSHAMSQVTGKQQSMLANYRVAYLRVQLVNVDSPGVNPDNIGGAFFGGTFGWYSPTKHNVKALQMLRKLHQLNIRESGGDFLSATPSLKSYKGLRLGMRDHHADVFGQTAIPQWNIASTGTTNPTFGALFQAYNNSNPNDAADYSNEMWSDRTGNLNTLGWSASSINSEMNLNAGAGITFAPDTNDFEWNGGDNYIDVLGGVMNFNVDYCCTASPLTIVPPFVDDDWVVKVTVGVLGWSDF